MTDEAFDLESPYVPTPIYFSDADALSYVAEDALVIARRVNDDWSLLLDLTTREPVGFRLERASRAFPTPSRACTDAEVEAMCRAHDREDAAQMGEPSPWDIAKDGVDWDDFRTSRLAAMRAALSTIPPVSVPSREEIARVILDYVMQDCNSDGICGELDAADAITALFTAPQSK